MQDELEFVDDYERPVLEKYERITPTPLEKKPKVSDTLKVKLHNIHSFIYIPF